ncbi:MAG: hypothetical protein Ct9H300mP1_13140 [Planctomycetaceae bacterium]|nr:MAG: hypothetical protein Ct9H300mP1_13140 [Planctomycetaceae bacterium]
MGLEIGAQQEKTVLADWLGPARVPASEESGWDDPAVTTDQNRTSGDWRLCPEVHFLRRR